VVVPEVPAQREPEDCALCHRVAVQGKELSGKIYCHDPERRDCYADAVATIYQFRTLAQKARDPNSRMPRSAAMIAAAAEKMRRLF
jgi:hypothetical protein